MSPNPGPASSNATPRPKTGTPAGTGLRLQLIAAESYACANRFSSLSAHLNPIGTADEAEITTAEMFCNEFLDDFDRDRLFDAIQAAPKDVPVENAITLLARFLDGEAKRAILLMLSTIAAADGSTDKPEHKLWKQTAKAFGADGKQIKELWEIDTTPAPDPTAPNTYSPNT